MKQDILLIQLHNLTVLCLRFLHDGLASSVLDLDSQVTLGNGVAWRQRVRLCNSQ